MPDAVVGIWCEAHFIFFFSYHPQDFIFFLLLSPPSHLTESLEEDIARFLEHRLIYYRSIREKVQDTPVGLAVDSNTANRCFTPYS